VWVFIAQLGVAVLATLSGWGRSAAAPPRMERFGAPPGWQRAYVDFEDQAFALVDSHGGRVGLAGWVGVPSDWDAPEPARSAPHFLHESPLKSLKALGREDDGLELFVAPRAAASVARSVVVRGHRYAVTAYVDGGAYVVMSATVDNHDLSAFGTSSASFYQDEPPGKRVRIPLVLVREPGRVHGLGAMEIDDRRGTLRDDAVEGSPVFALTGRQAAEMGFVEGGPRSVVPLWRVGARIRAVKGVAPAPAPAPVPAQPAGYLGIGMKTVRAGVAVDEVQPGSPAAVAGLRVGDVIERYDIVPHPTAEMLRDDLFVARPFSFHQLVVRRGARRWTMPVRLGERP
jgi:hypothetical protein